MFIRSTTWGTRESLITSGHAEILPNIEQVVFTINRISASDFSFLDRFNFTIIKNKKNQLISKCKFYRKPEQTDRVVLPSYNTPTEPRHT